ncbi:hypothetical protein LSUE1_G000990 [Lachnellula suecica]|uniref:Uncharacterized protein n=1 Tax=Lachnellula suecica TaxID=602035 RepID=A0A8T9CJQ9_9HELO|nr:hypothetical protein LSUE1_G000990 [Lachnellula suecica]
MASGAHEHEHESSAPLDFGTSKTVNLNGGGNGNISNSSGKPRHTATLYDAVAGRVSSAGFIPRRLVFSSTRDTPSSSAAPVPPEAVLFRRKNAPTRFAEDDLYFANERRPGIDLPSSDLLKALHCYASDFYSRNTTDRGGGDWKSLDETALLALAILMEEVSTLSKAGDMVFTEGEEAADSSLPTTRKPKGRASKRLRVDQSQIDVN